MDLIDVINQIVQNNNEASKPTELIIGTVEKVNPLAVRISMDMAALPAEVLLLTDGVVEREEDVTVSSGFASLLAGYNITVPADTVIGKVKVQNGLAAGDKVILLRVLKGQKFIVLSKA